MELVLNLIDPKGKKPTEVEYVATMKKNNIIKMLQQALQYPDRYVFANASPVDEMEEKTPAQDLVTLQEWMDSKRIVIELADKQRLANRVAEIYAQHYKAKPRVVARKNDQGLFRNKAYAFDTDELWVLDEAIKSVKYLIDPGNNVA